MTRDVRYFAYDTLQQGFANHEQYEGELGAPLGRYRTVDRFPLVVPRLRRARTRAAATAGYARDGITLDGTLGRPRTRRGLLLGIGEDSTATRAPSAANEGWWEMLRLAPPVAGALLIGDALGVDRVAGYAIVLALVIVLAPAWLLILRALRSSPRDR